MWFLIRLIAALILGVIELILFIVQIIAAIAFTLGGTAAMHLVYGLASLVGLLFPGGVFYLISPIFEA
ncbi:hypothetical protein GCM10010116_36890 [Microbispora rosea subsp. aerata]|nr:hypothetical protein GCM10010116_36890 [Microbispora rosea subsp. aerata]GIH56675.1 hypothetical protein Mro02_35890 [Microbispora rosea subsp. aerata]GLJ82048.1 hypothetical protein GCM10017588_07730 [Microbispora rosea subsp. aerata]